MIPLDPAGLGPFPEPPRTGPLLPRLLAVPLLSYGPETARERRARRVVEGLLSIGIVLSVAISLAQEGGVGPDAPGAVAWRSIPVDLARDPPWLLRLLPGVGPTRAAALVRDREANGPLPAVVSLVRVPGFGAKTAASLAAAGAVASGHKPEDGARAPP